MLIRLLNWLHLQKKPMNLEEFRLRLLLAGWDECTKMPHMYANAKMAWKKQGAIITYKTGSEYLIWDHKRAIRYTQAWSFEGMIKKFVEE